jgi:hypothetical protein
MGAIPLPPPPPVSALTCHGVTLTFTIQLLRLCSVECCDDTSKGTYLLARRSGIDTWPVRVGFMGDEVSVGGSLLRVLWFCYFSIIQTILHTHI